MRDEAVAKRVGGEAVERPRDQGPHGLPVALRSAQHVRVSRGEFDQTWTKRIVLVQWILSGKAAMAVGAERLTFAPGDVAVYLPNIPLRFWALEPVNEVCWFTVDGALAEQFALELKLSPGVYPYGSAPVQQIHELMESLRDDTALGRRRSSVLAIQMLYELADITRTPEIPSVVQQARHMIDQEFGDPDLSIEQIASRLYYHRGSLSRLFHKHVGVSMRNYINDLRLQEARALLQHTSDKIGEVARKCGFREGAYFCRWLRKHAGMTPKDLRVNSEQ
jgi:AraC-like DNA-binding protein